MNKKISNDELNLTVELINAGLINIDDGYLLACRANTAKLIERWLKNTNSSIMINSVNYIIADKQFKELTGYTLDEINKFTDEYKHNQVCFRFITNCQYLLDNNKMHINGPKLECKLEHLIELTKYNFYLDVTIDGDKAIIDVDLLNTNNDIDLYKHLRSDELKPCE